MKWLIGAIGGFLTYFIRFLAKKIGSKKVLILILVPLYLAMIGFLISFAVYVISYIMKIWNLLKDILPKLTDYSSGASGSFGGLSNSTMISSAMEFLHVSGLASAFSFSIELFISLLSLYFVIQLYKIVVFVRKTITDYIKDLSYIM